MWTNRQAVVVGLEAPVGATLGPSPRSRASHLCCEEANPANVDAIGTSSCAMRIRSGLTIGRGVPDARNAHRPVLALQA
jgi:hypothetical protein